MSKQNPTVEEVIALLPETVTLHYVDYRESLNEKTELIQKCISNGNMDALHEALSDWYDDVYIMDEVTEELKEDIQRSFCVSEEKAEEIYCEYEDEIRDAIYERDDSDVLTDLLRNTRNMVFFYDTGHYVECSYPASEASIRLERMKIKNILKLRSSDYDKLIDNMMLQSSYGGNLVIYFTADPEHILKSVESGAYNTISFSGHVNIAIPNHAVGAGDHTSFKHSFSLPFIKDNLLLCKEVKYSYTYEVCGMSSNWCSSTVWSLSRQEVVDGEINVSHVGDYIAEQARLDKVYKDGGCTPGDMNITRHRNIQYHNQPMYCRNECPTCHTVWVD